MPASLPARPQTTNTKRPAPRGDAAYPRKRAITACEVCRARRTKCDNQRPACSFCTKTGAKCNYPTDTQDYSAYDAASLRILERLDDLEVLLRCPAPFSADEQSAPKVTEANSVRHLPADRSWLLPSHPDTLLSLFTNEELLGLRLLPSPLALEPDLSVAETSVRSPASVADLDATSSRQHVDNFFNYVHVKNPVLHEANTRSMVSRLSLYGADWSTESCLALLICALGSIAGPFDENTHVTPESPAYKTSQAYFRAAERRLGNCVTRSGIIEAQCLFFAGVYQMCIFCPFDAWRLFSQALSCCQNFTFLRMQNSLTHTLPSSPGMDKILQVAEQSVYWSAWKSESELRSLLCLPDFPSSQSNVLYPPFFPTPPSPTRYHEEDYQHETRIQRESMSWYFYLTEISLNRLTSRIANDIFSTDARTEWGLMKNLVDCLPQRLKDLETWIAALPEPITLHTAPEFDNVCKFVIRGKLMNIYEMLYWPFLAYYLLGTPGREPEDHLAASEHSNRFCEYAEAALIWHQKRLEVNKPGFRHRHHGTWFMIGTCVRSAVMLLEAHKFNLTNQINVQLAMPDNWQDAVMDVVQLNIFWQFEAADACQRVPLLERLVRDVDILAD